MKNPKNPVLRLTQLGIIMVIDKKLHADPKIIKKIAEAIDDNTMTPAELESASLDIYKRLRVI